MATATYRVWYSTRFDGVWSRRGSMVTLDPDDPTTIDLIARGRVRLEESEATGIPKSILDAKGDLVVATAAGTPARLAVGTNGCVLTADSGEASGVKWAEASGGGGTTTTAQYTTASLANNARESSGTITMAKTYTVAKIVTDVASRVRLYATAAAQTADASRAVGTDPTGSHGVVLDLVTTAGTLTWLITPSVVGASLESTPAATIPITIDNLSGGTTTVTATITYLPIEA